MKKKPLMPEYEEDYTVSEDYDLQHDQINKELGTDFTCSICGRTVHEFGNNPYPFIEDPSALCCDACNTTFVLRIRLARLYHQKEVEHDS